MEAERCQTFFCQVESTDVLEQVQGQVNGLLVRRVHDLPQEGLGEAQPEALDLEDDLFEAGPQNFRQNELVEGHLPGSAELKSRGSVRD